jgi:hypothetical protein
VVYRFSSNTFSSKIEERIMRKIVFSLFTTAAATVMLAATIGVASTAKATDVIQVAQSQGRGGGAGAGTGLGRSGSAPGMQQQDRLRDPSQHPPGTTPPRTKDDPDQTQDRDRDRDRVRDPSTKEGAEPEQDRDRDRVRTPPPSRR